MAMNMELHAAMMRDVDAKLAKLDEKTNLRLDSLGEKVDKLADKVDKLAVTTTELTGVVQVLAHVVQSHERRLENLETNRAA